jgi:signal recognition particle subunit SRP54
LRLKKRSFCTSLIVVLLLQHLLTTFYSSAMFNFFTQKISTIFSDLFKTKQLSQKHVDATLTQLRKLFIDADVPLAVVQAFTSEVERDVVGKAIVSSLKPAEQLVKIIHDRLSTLMGGKNEEPKSLQGIVLVMGIQGSGKTTTIPKLAYYTRQQLLKKNKTCRILVSSLDFNRPAGIEQLCQLTKQAGVEWYQPTNTMLAAAAQDLADYSKTSKFDLVLVDTAGRLHVDQNELQSLVQVKSILKPQKSLLVVDSMLGQASLKIAESFNEAVGFDEAILTKVDSDAKGGTALSFFYTLNKQVIFVTEGEKLENIAPFNAERMAGRLMGMGDLQTLLERAQDKLSQEEQKRSDRAMREGRLTYNDFAKQLAVFDKIGSLSSILKYMPGATMISQEKLQQGEVELKKFRAIVGSMKAKERDLIVPVKLWRKKELAFGAGVSIADVDSFFKRFEQAQQYVKLLGKNSFFKGL